MVRRLGGAGDGKAAGRGWSGGWAGLALVKRLGGAGAQRVGTSTADEVSLARLWVEFVVLACARPLGAFRAYDLELCRGQELLPFSVALLDRELILIRRHASLARIQRGSSSECGQRRRCESNKAQRRAFGRRTENRRATWRGHAP